jgi:hypothetical protein
MGNGESAHWIEGHDDSKLLIFFSIVVKKLFVKKFIFLK